MTGKPQKIFISHFMAAAIILTLILIPSSIVWGDETTITNTTGSTIPTSVPKQRRIHCPRKSEQAELKVEVSKDRVRQRFLRDLPDPEEQWDEMTDCFMGFSEEILQALEILKAVIMMDTTRFPLPEMPDMDDILRFACKLARSKISNTFSQHFFAVSEMVETALQGLHGISYNRGNITIDVRAVLEGYTGLKIPFPPGGDMHSYTIWERDKKKDDEDEVPSQLGGEFGDAEAWAQALAFLDDYENNYLNVEPGQEANVHYGNNVNHGNTGYTSVAGKPQSMPQLTDQYWEWIVGASEKYNLPPTFLASLLYQESKFNPNAYNKTSKATGMAQFLPSTAADGWVKDPYNAQQSIYGAANYLRNFVAKYTGDDLFWMAAGYNAGPGKGWVKAKDISKAVINEQKKYAPEVIARMKRLDAEINSRTTSVTTRSQIAD